jgi:hypothetical protein
LQYPCTLDTSRTSCAPLLLEQLLQLRACQRDGCQRIAERLRCKRVCIRHDPAATRGPQIGAQAAGISERNPRTLCTCDAELRVGNQTSERGVAARCRTAIEFGSDAAHRLLRHRCSNPKVMFDDCLHLGIGRKRRIRCAQPRVRVGSVRHRQVARASAVAHDIARHAVDLEVNHRNESAVRRGLHHWTAVDNAVVSAMRVSGQHHVDRRIELADDIEDRTARVAARVEAAIDFATLMHNCDEGLHALRSQFACVSIDRLRFGCEPYGGNAPLGTTMPAVARVTAPMNPIRTPSIVLIQVAATTG